MIWCEACVGHPLNTYKKGFKRDKIICDKGVGKVSLSHYVPNTMDRMLHGFTQDRSYGYIQINHEDKSWLYCSLYCLNHHSSIEKLAVGMSDFDKHDILEQFNIEKKQKEKIHYVFPKTEIEIKKEKEAKIKKFVHEENELLLHDPLKELKDQNTNLKQKLEMFQNKQKEIVNGIQKDEDKRNLSLMKEVNKLNELLKEKDKTIFQQHCRIIELERNHKPDE
jgi:hypothetical protein